MACGYCGRSEGEEHRDHLIPQSRGGSDEPENCVMACGGCNLEKSDRTPSEWKPEGLSDALYARERRLAKKYAMKARTKRGRPVRTAFEKSAGTWPTDSPSLVGSWFLEVVFEDEVPQILRTGWIAARVDSAHYLLDERSIGLGFPRRRFVVDLGTVQRLRLYPTRYEMEVAQARLLGQGDHIEVRHMWKVIDELDEQFHPDDEREWA